MKTKTNYHALAIERMNRETNRAIAQVEMLKKLYKEMKSSKVAKS